MGKITGFLEYERLEEGYEPRAERVKHYREFVIAPRRRAGQGAGRALHGLRHAVLQQRLPGQQHHSGLERPGLPQRLEAARSTTLHSTNNFPEFTGRICPAPCEAACTLNINDDPVGIKSIEHAIIDQAWDEGWVAPQPPTRKTGKKVAVVGSGPAGMACRAAARARRPRRDACSRRTTASAACCATASPTSRWRSRTSTGASSRCRPKASTFRTGVLVGDAAARRTVTNWAQRDDRAEAAAGASSTPCVLAGGAEQPRDLPVPGPRARRRALRDGVPAAAEQGRRRRQGQGPDPAPTGKHVVVIGGGDTGSRLRRHQQPPRREVSVTQFELLPQPPEEENKPLVWPYWPIKLRTSSSHEEGCERDWRSRPRSSSARSGKVKALKAVRVEWKDGKMVEVPGSRVQSMQGRPGAAGDGLRPPGAAGARGFGVEKDARGNAKASTDGDGGYATNVAKVFAAGDMRRGQSLVVWAIREGRQARARGRRVPDGLQRRCRADSRSRPVPPAWLRLAALQRCACG